MLCEMLNIKAEKRMFPFAGGNSPQKFVNNAALAIASGESRATLITGSETEYAASRAKRAEVKLEWPVEEVPERFDRCRRLGTNDFENYYNLMLPTVPYK